MFSIFYRAVLLLFVAISLSGCDKLNAIDVLKSDVAGQQLRISDLVKESQSSYEQMREVRGELAAQENEIAALKNELTALESIRSKTARNDPPIISNPQVAQLNSSIVQCVKAVRTSSSSAVYANFDAYYNPASGRVLNNNQYVDESAVYAFDKCMAVHGWPLK